MNLQGKFNVPYGYKHHLEPCDSAKICAASVALSSAQLLCKDFKLSVANAKAGDLVYLDPPYTVAHGSNGFIKYNTRIFSWHDQIRLAAVASNLDRRGCRVIVSNADHPSIRTLYSGFKIKEVVRASVIAADGAHRREITECIFHNGE